MNMNNEVKLIGRVGNDVVESLRYVNGAAVATVILAVPRIGKDNKDVDWVRCEFWDRKAEVLSQYAHKGTLIMVSGSLRVDQWEKEGVKREKVFVRATNFEFMPSNRPKEVN